MNERPNFLFFITDQQRADYLGCYGHRVLRTPNIDALAANGRRFDRCYVASPICMPNRATLMTGRMPSLHKVRSNGIPLSLQAVTFVDLLRAHGYRTGLIGKSHLQNMTGRPAALRRADPPAGYSAAPAELAEAIKPLSGDGPYDQEAPQRWQSAQPLRLTLPFYGFDHVDLCTEHGDQVGGHYYQWLRQRRPDADQLRDPKNQLPHAYICPQAVRTAVPEELYPTTYIADKACDYLDSLAGDDPSRPFFAMVSFPDPHHPFTPPGKYWDMYDPADMTLPPSFFVNRESMPPHVRWVHQQRAAGIAPASPQTVFAVDEREAREAMALTCGMITMIDDAIGRVLRRLAELKLEQNTVIVFTSDHGDFMGDHRLMLKGPLHYQSLIRVPLIWKDPAIAHPGPCDTLCSTLDLAPSILDRAKIQANNGIQGRSLLPAVGGQADAFDGVLIEEDGQRKILGFDQPPRLLTLVTNSWRMSVYHGCEWGELYRLSEDPAEIVNRWDDPACAGVKSELLELMVRKQLALSDRSPLPTASA